MNNSKITFLDVFRKPTIVGNVVDPSPSIADINPIKVSLRIIATLGLTDEPLGISSEELIAMAIALVNADNELSDLVAKSSISHVDLKELCNVLQHPLSGKT